MFYGQSSCVCLIWHFPCSWTFEKKYSLFHQMAPKASVLRINMHFWTSTTWGKQRAKLAWSWLSRGCRERGLRNQPPRPSPALCFPGRQRAFWVLLSDPVRLSVTYTEVLFWNFREHNEWTWALCPLRLGCFCRSAPWACEGRCSYVHLGRVARLEPLI